MGFKGVSRRSPGLLSTTTTTTTTTTTGGDANQQNSGSQNKFDYQNYVSKTRTTSFKSTSSRSESISSETPDLSFEDFPKDSKMAATVGTPQEERTNLTDVFSFFEKGGAKKAGQKENIAMKTHLQFEAIRRAGTASMLKDKFEGGEDSEDEEEEEEEEDDYFTRSTADPNLVKCERVNPKKKKNIGAEINLDSRGLRDQFDSGQMSGNYTTKIDERAKEIEEMRKLKADGIKDVWESQPGEDCSFAVNVFNRCPKEWVFFSL